MWHLLPYQAEAKLLKLEDVLQLGKSPATLNVKGKKIHKIYLWNCSSVTWTQIFLAADFSDTRLIYLLLIAVHCQAQMLINIPGITSAQQRNMIPTLLRRNRDTSDLPKVIQGEWGRARNSTQSTRIFRQSLNSKMSLPFYQIIHVSQKPIISSLNA